MTNPAPVNSGTLLDRIDNDLELLGELIEIYEEDGAQHLQTMELAITEENADRLEKSAHSFKGASRNMSADNLADIAYALEQSGNSGNLANAGELLKTLRKEFERVVPALKKLLE
jgi:HPt (histidine-containing phosphotransfer) domain-containing protein